VGKPYQDELRLLASSYEWACGLDVSELKAALIRLGGLPLISIGSGGSLTAAHFQCQIHEHSTGYLAKPLTPLLAASLGHAVLKAGVTLLSAEGRNPDIRGVFRKIVESDPQGLLALCLKLNAPLIGDIQSTMAGAGVAYDMPWGKDGYLATNSLIAMCCLLFRGYAEAFPGTLPTLLCSLDTALSQVAPELETVLSDIENLVKSSDKKTFLILHDKQTQVLAVDLESKLIESSMATVIVSDLRNFAHGRHLWSHINQEGVVALLLSHNDQKEIRATTKKLLPDILPVVELNLEGDPHVAMLLSIAISIKIIGAIGRAKQFDPGSPFVPMFGKHLYRFDAFQHQVANCSQSVASMQLAVMRKLGASRSCDWRQPYALHLQEAYPKILEKLELARFSGIVLDYDSTLCTPDQRFGNLPLIVGSELERLLALGINLGIATGRGGSVMTAVKNVISPRFWERIWIGMYNGGLIQRLDNTCPAELVPQNEQLQNLSKRIEADPYLGKVVHCELRRTQLTINMTHPSLFDHAWPLVQSLISLQEYSGLKALRSLHSWDIIAQSTSKKVVHQTLENIASQKTEILCIGDRGRWPGNDCELLGHTYALGVDEVSVDTNSAWNLAPSGVYGVAATIFYLRAIELENNIFRIQLKNES